MWQTDWLRRCQHSHMCIFKHDASRSIVKVWFSCVSWSFVTNFHYVQFESYDGLMTWIQSVPHRKLLYVSEKSQVLNDIRVSKRWQNSHFYVSKRVHQNDILAKKKQKKTHKKTLKNVTKKEVSCIESRSWILSHISLWSADLQNRDVWLCLAYHLPCCFILLPGVREMTQLLTGSPFHRIITTLPILPISYVSVIALTRFVENNHLHIQINYRN